MSRIPTTGGDVVVRKPQNNIYTVLAVIGTVVAVLGLIVIYLRATALDINLFK